MANQLQWSQNASGRTTYTFDADGNQERVLAPDGSRTTTVWDYENRATSVQLPSGIRNTMAYEPGGLRVKLEESTGTKKFVWDDQNYLAETDGSNDTQVVYTNEPQRYGHLISQRGGGTTSWYHFDALDSTRQLTDALQSITDQRLYDAWGIVVGSSGSTVFPFQYVGAIGYYTDADREAVYIRARIYQPGAARWLSVDPQSAKFFSRMAAIPGDRRIWKNITNGYTYLDPINLRDPSGEAECKFQVCSTPLGDPLAGLVARHLFVICQGTGYRAGPSRNSNSPRGEAGEGDDTCPCNSVGRGQVIETIGRYDETFIDHPRGGANYPTDQLICKEVTVFDYEKCSDLCDCFKEKLLNIRKCCIKYRPQPLPGREDANSNTSISWILQDCLGIPASQVGQRLPNDNKLEPGLWQKVPPCVTFGLGAK